MSRPRSRYPLVLGACAASLVTGCAQMGPPIEAQGPRVEAVYRVQQPVGTAAGQYAIGRMDLAEGRSEAAISRFRQALRIEPSFVGAHNGLGVAYGQIGRFAEAIEAFRGALASGPAAAHVLGNLGFAQLRAGQLDEASDSLRRSHDLDPGNERTRANIRLLAEARRELLEREFAARAESGDSVESADSIVLTPVRSASAAQAAPAPATAPDAALAVATGVEGAASELAESANTPPATKVLAPPLAADAVTPALATGEAVIHTPVAAQHSAVITLLARVSAARALGEAPNLSAYEIVRSASGSEALVQVSPGIYELRAPEVASGGSVSKSPLAASTAPSPGSIPVAPTPGWISDRVARAPFVPPAWTVAGDVPSPSLEPVRVSVVPSRVAELRSVLGGSKATTLMLTEPPGGGLLLAALSGFEVSNGAGVDRLATRTAREFSRLGAKVARVSNFAGYGKQQTEIHYRAGHADDAKAIQQYLPVVATLIETSQMRAGVDVRLVVGRDMAPGPIAGSGQNRRPALQAQSPENSVLAAAATH